MDEKMLLEAISAMMDTKLEPIHKRLENLELSHSALRNDVRIMKHDIKEISWKVDTLYDWTDNLDIKVKNIDDRTA